MSKKKLLIKFQFYLYDRCLLTDDYEQSFEQEAKDFLKRLKNKKKK
jgi:hypothetical protein